MRIFSSPKMAATLGMTLTVGALAMLTIKPAAAQLRTGPEPATVNYTSAVRLGGYLPFDSSIRQDVGTIAFSGGIDYAIQNHPSVARTVVSVDVISRTSGNHHLQVIPVTIGQFNYNGGDWNNRPYIGYGLGLYFVQEALTDVLGNDYTTNGLAFGGYLAAGLDFQDHYFVDARYHYASHIGPVSAQGLQITAGIRF